MKKGVKRVAWAVAAVFILLAAAGLYVCAPKIYFLLTMKPAGTGWIVDGKVCGVKSAIHTDYFVKTDSGYVMFDAGLSPKKAAAALKGVNIGIDDVKWIFLTHSDYDHVSALAAFPNAKIHMYVRERRLIDGRMKRGPFGRNRLPKGVDAGKIITVRDGQMLSLNGTSVFCVGAYGHTPGSMMYYVDSAYLFTGDAFMVTKGNIGVHPFTMDAELGMETIGRLREFIDGSTLVLTSHYGVHEKIGFDKIR